MLDFFLKLLLCVIISVSVGTAVFFVDKIFFFDQNDKYFCMQQIVSQSISPDHKHVAVAYKGTCPLASDFFPAVYIRNINEELKIKTRNQIESEQICDFSYAQSNINLKWEKPDLLEIYSDYLNTDCATSFKGINLITKKLNTSPDGNYQIIHSYEMGGGAAGWCSQFVAVTLSTDFENKMPVNANDDKIVFKAKCNAKITATWEGVTTLLINYSDRNSPHSLPITMRDKDKTQKVSIRYLNEK